MNILTIILIILAIIIFIILIFLYIGLKIQINYKLKNIDYNVSINIKFLKFTIFEKKIPDEKIDDPEKLKEDSEKKSLKDKYNEIKPFIPLIKNSKEPIINFLKTCKKSIKLNNFNNHTCLGLYNYADTAEIIGYLYALNTLPNLSNNILLTAEPIFGEEVLDLKGEISFKINLFKPFFGVLKLIMDKNIREIIKRFITLIKNNKKSSKENSK